MQRAYVNQPILPPGVQPGLSPETRRARWNHSWIIGIIAGVVIVGVFFWLSQRAASNPIPSQIRQAAAFPLAYPSWLPPKAVVNGDSFDVTSQVMTFTVGYDQGKKLLFSEQPKPSAFDFDSFYSDQLTNKKTLAVQPGTATIGDFQSGQFASVVGDKTWLLINAPQGIDNAQFERLVQGLRQ